MDRPPLPEIDQAGDERTLLVQFLDYYRATLVDRAWGLGEAQLRTPHEPSSLTLAGLLGHMAFVEYIWFAVRLDGADMPEPFASLDWEADADAEMTIAETWPVEQVMAQLAAAVEDSRRRTEAASSLDQRSAAVNDDGEQWDLRWILIHMIEEYARHCGHADLIREAIDGDLAP